MIGMIAFMGTDDRTRSGNFPKAASSAPANQRAAILSSYSGNGANSPQPVEPLINAPVRTPIPRNSVVKLNENGTHCFATNSIDIS